MKKIIPLNVYITSRNTRIYVYCKPINNKIPSLQQLAARSVAKLMQQKEYLTAYKQDKSNPILGHIE